MNMEKLLKADSITAASSSPWGILALMNLIIGIMALTFFKDAADKVKLSSFILLLLGIIGFGVTILPQEKPTTFLNANSEFLIESWIYSQQVYPDDAVVCKISFHDDNSQNRSNNIQKYL